MILYINGKPLANLGDNQAFHKSMLQKIGCAFAKAPGISKVQFVSQAEAIIVKRDNKQISIFSLAKR